MADEAKQADEGQQSQAQPQAAAAGGSKSYVLNESSTVSEVQVDDKVVSAHGDPVQLTDDQYERASAIDGVELAESSGKKES
jgi:hypothetical protein